MGWFDFLFKRKNTQQVVAQAEEEQRLAHYMLAHYTLRSVGLENPLLYLGVLASPERERFLQQMFDLVLERCEEPPDFAARDLKVHTVRVREFPCAVVEMPTPVAVPEAYFTALVLLANSRAELPENGENMPARYFTLEYGIDLDGTARTVLCEWDRDGRHSNFGGGTSEPTLDNFLGDIEQLLFRDTEGAAAMFIPPRT